MTDAERQTRVDLAACYRLLAHYRMTDLIYTHVSAKIPGTKEEFLINEFGRLFEETTASSLVKLDLQGRAFEGSKGDVNLAGFAIHRAVHKARPEVHCVIHTHTAAGIAVSAQAEGLRPLSQHAARFYNRIGYVRYHGVVLTPEDEAGLVQEMGNFNAVILRNHGLLVCGTTIPEAFVLTHYLERACQIQIAAQSGGGRLEEIDAAVAEATAAHFEQVGNRPSRFPPGTGQRDWPALLRMLDRTDTSYRD